MTDETQIREDILEELASVVIRFAGDSGDGMQLTGTQFTNTAAIFGNDISTLPDYPAEIRAPVGTLAGVSGFQVHLSSTDIRTPGDAPRVLIAMNPAALATNIGDLQPGGIVIVNTDSFTHKNLQKANYDSNPLKDGSLDDYQVFEIPLTTLNRNALENIEGLNAKEVDRSKNFFALGLIFWIFDRSLKPTLEWVEKKFAKRPAVVEANSRALRAGYNFGDTTRALQRRYHIRPAKLPAGIYRNITGNQAAAYGFLTAAHKAGKTLFYGAYPITPASDILHSLAPLKHFDVRTFQAEDEIAAMGAVIGAAFGGAFAVAGTSGPGVALKSEAIGLGVMLELPMVIANIQRGGPATGLPTKPEQSDLLQAMFGRNGESPTPVVAPTSPSDCFDMAIEAFRLAVHASCPVFFLSDGYLANSSEPWLIPDPDGLPSIRVEHPEDPEDFQAYRRDPESLARNWAIPGTPHLEHRLGGLEKRDGTGNVSYNPDDHEQMVGVRLEKVKRLANVIPEQDVFGPSEGSLLVVGWGSTFGAIRTAVEQAQTAGKSISHAHIRYINPFPHNLGKLLNRFDRVLVPEMNNGQLALLLQGRFLREVVSFPKVRGRPFRISEIRARIEELSPGKE
ncbi:MAG: 2-oxoacid:acceptor oxidoreductase subunit alpha [Anaerolineales bacterium]